MRSTLILVFCTFFASVAQAKDTRFWNLTSNSINKFYLAPAGSNNYGPNQCANDRDGTVDHDERLKITGIAAGRYDAKIADTNGRVCLVKNIEVKDGAVVSLEDKDLTNCNK